MSKKKSLATQAPSAETSDTFVTKLVVDPTAPPSVVLLCGYPGASALKGSSRLYLTANLNAWVDIPEDAVMHRVEVSREIDCLGAMYVWVRREAALKPGYRTR